METKYMNNLIEYIHLRCPAFVLQINSRKYCVNWQASSVCWPVSDLFYTPSPCSESFGVARTVNLVIARILHQGKGSVLRKREVLPTTVIPSVISTCLIGNQWWRYLSPQAPLWSANTLSSIVPLLLWLPGRMTVLFATSTLFENATFVKKRTCPICMPFCYRWIECTHQPSRGRTTLSAISHCCPIIWVMLRRLGSFLWTIYFPETSYITPRLHFYGNAECCTASIAPSIHLLAEEASLALYTLVNRYTSLHDTSLITTIDNVRPRSPELERQPTGTATCVHCLKRMEIQTLDLYVHLASNQLHLSLKQLLYRAVYEPALHFVHGCLSLYMKRGSCRRPWVPPI